MSLKIEFTRQEAEAVIDALKPLVIAQVSTNNLWLTEGIFWDLVTAFRYDMVDTIGRYKQSPKIAEAAAKANKALCEVLDEIRLATRNKDS